MEEDQELSKRERKKLNKEKKVESESGSSMKNKLLIVGAIIAVAIGAFWFMYRGSGDTLTNPSETQETLSPSEVSENDYKKGPDEAVVTMVEYGDFQCPACAAYSPIVNQLAEAFPTDLRIVYRHFPLRSIHRHAQISAQAVEAAGKQGMFWEMATILFERQDDWVNVRDPRSMFVAYAEELAMNKEEFETYMNSEEAKSAVNADYDSGISAGVNSTPTFFVNGEKITNPQGLEPFTALIQQKIDENKPEIEGSEGTEEGEATEESEITPTL